MILQLESSLSLEGDHLLLSDVVSHVAGVETLRKSALAEEDGVDSGGVGREASTGLLRNGGLGSCVGLKSWQSRDTNPLVGPDDRLLGRDHLSSSGDIGHGEEAWHHSRGSWGKPRR